MSRYHENLDVELVSVSGLTAGRPELKPPFVHNG